MTVISWQAVLASSAFFGGTIIQGLLVLNYERYFFQMWHGTLLFYAIFALSLFVNTVLARLLPKIESMVLSIHVIEFFGISIKYILLRMARRKTSLPLSTTAEAGVQMDYSTSLDYPRACLHSSVRGS